MSSSSGLLEALLVRVAERIAASSPRWTPTNCYPTATPFPETIPTLERFCTVAPGEGTFDDAFDAGGGAVLSERVTIVVTAWRQLPGEPGRGKTIAGESVLAEREAILSILVESWSPTLAGRALLIEPLVPRKSFAPEVRRGTHGGTWLGAGLAFEATLDRAIAIG